MCFFFLTFDSKRIFTRSEGLPFSGLLDHHHLPPPAVQLIAQFPRLPAIAIRPLCFTLDLKTPSQ